MSSHRRAWGSPFEKQPQREPEPASPFESSSHAMDHEGAVKMAIAKAFKDIDTFGELNILNIDGLIPRRYRAGSMTHDSVRLGHARVTVEFPKRRAGAPRWASLEVHTDRQGMWMPPSVMVVEGRAMLINQAVFDDWFGATDSIGADHRDKGGWGGPEVTEKDDMNARTTQRRRR